MSHEVWLQIYFIFIADPYKEGLPEWDLIATTYFISHQEMLVKDLLELLWDVTVVNFETGDVL